MSRSRRKTPIVGITTSESEKQDKRKANRALRTATRRAVATGAEIMPLPNDVSKVWAMSKDGKAYIDPIMQPKAMRK
jgi:hypothetical protein